MSNALMKDADVLRIMKIAEGLLNGTKRLVIESIATAREEGVEFQALGPEHTIVVDYKHTFRVEDCNDAEPE